MPEPLRFSRLKLIARSPAHYRAATSPDAPPVDSPAMRLGRHVHALVLDPSAAPIVYEGERRGKAWLDFKAAHEGREIVTASEADKAEQIAAAVLADPAARPLVLGDHVREQRIDWTCAGRPFRSTPDVITADGWIVDLKTTTDASIRGFQRRAWNLAYHAQLACYREAVRSTGRGVEAAALIAVETSFPFAVSVHRLSGRVLAEGDRLWRSWLEILNVCEASDHWPGYADGAVNFDVPEWMADEADEGGDDDA